MKQLTIVTNKNCHNCNLLKEFLIFYQIPYENVDASTVVGNSLLKTYKLSVVPQIFVDNKLFVPGGYRTIKTMRKQEILDRISQF